MHVLEQPFGHLEVVEGVRPSPYERAKFAFLFHLQLYVRSWRDMTLWPRVY